MKKMVLFASAALVATGGWAGTFSAGNVPADAKWVVHADVEKIRSSEFTLGVIEKIKEQNCRKLDAFSLILNFNLQEDVDTVSIFGSSFEGDNQGVLVLDGYFDEYNLESILLANESYGTTYHNDDTIHYWVPGSKKSSPQNRRYGAMAHDGTVIAGTDAELVGQALDVLNHIAPSLKKGSPLDLSGRTGSAIIAAAFEVPEDIKLPAKAQILQHAQSLSFILSENDGKLVAEVAITAGSADVATQIEFVLNGLVAMTKLKADERPELAKLARVTTVQAKGSCVSVSMECPVEKVLEAIQ